MGEHPLEVRDLTVAYHRKPVVQSVNLTLPEGQLVGVVGPNGAGKSTMLKAILGLVPAAAGEVRVFGKPYTAQRSLVGYVPQRGSVDWDFPTDALDVVLMGRYGRLGWFRRPGAKDRELAMECLRQVGMADFANRQISQLSGGQQQRVFLARALAQDARLYFMDEPFAGVDAATEKAIVALLGALKERGKTVVVVHHDLQTVKEYFDWLVLLNMRLIAFGPTEQVFTSENLQKAYGGRLTQLGAGALGAEVGAAALGAAAETTAGAVAGAAAGAAAGVAEAAGGAAAGADSHGGGIAAAPGATPAWEEA